MTSAVIDHEATGLGRVALQYSQSQKFLAYLRALMAPMDELEAVFQKISEQADIDKADGVNLDVIGDIVGIDRVIPESVQLAFFGFSDNPAALVFGEEGHPGIGGRLYEEGEPFLTTTVLSNPEYRVLIRAKIVKNHARGTNEDVLNGLAFLFDADATGTQVNVTDVGGMAIQVGIGRWLSFMEKVLITSLDILPRPGGVRISQRVNYDAGNYFGFDGQPGALSFGEEGQPSIGGQFAEEF